MIENKLIHYETRNAFEAEKPNIGDTSVAFISEDRTIYTHGVEYNCAEALQRASDIDREIRDLIDQKNQEIIDAINQLTRETEEQAEQNRQEAIRRLQEAEAALEEIRNRLSQMTEDQGDAGQEIDEINGRIALFAEWWNTADQTFTNIQQTLDAHEGLISTVGEHYNTLNSELNTYKNEVNLRLGQLTQELEHIDVTDKVRTVIGTEIDAPNGLFKLFAKTSQIIDDSDVQQWVEQKFNSLDPSWETLVNKVITNENDISKNTTAITGIKADISSHDAILREFSSWKQGASESIAALELGSSSSGASYTLTATKIYDALNGDSTNGKRVAATIMGWVNDEGSGITLNANKINFDADTLRFISDNIVIDGSKIELPDDFTVDGSKIHIPAANVDGLSSLVASLIAATSITSTSINVSNNQGSLVVDEDGIDISTSTGKAFEVNTAGGTGSIAYGNIAWDSLGNVFIKNANVSDSNNDDYYTKTEIDNMLNRLQNSLGISEGAQLPLLDIYYYLSIESSAEYYDAVYGSYINTHVYPYIFTLRIKGILKMPDGTTSYTYTNTNASGNDPLRVAAYQSNKYPIRYSNTETRTDGTELRHYVYKYKGIDSIYENGRYYWTNGKTKTVTIMGSDDYDQNTTVLYTNRYLPTDEKPTVKLHSLLTKTDMIQIISNILLSNVGSAGSGLYNIHTQLLEKLDDNSIPRLESTDQVSVKTHYVIYNSNVRDGAGNTDDYSTVINYLDEICGDIFLAARTAFMQTLPKFENIIYQVKDIYLPDDLRYYPYGNPDE